MKWNKPLASRETAKCIYAHRNEYSFYVSPDNYAPCMYVPLRLCLCEFLFVSFRLEWKERERERKTTTTRIYGVMLAFWCEKKNHFIHFLHTYKCIFSSFLYPYIIYIYSRFDLLNIVSCSCFAFVFLLIFDLLMALTYERSGFCIRPTIHWMNHLNRTHGKCKSHECERY